MGQIMGHGVLLCPTTGSAVAAASWRRCSSWHWTLVKATEGHKRLKRSTYHSRYPGGFLFLQATNAYSTIAIFFKKEEKKDVAFSDGSVLARTVLHVRLTLSLSLSVSVSISLSLSLFLSLSLACFPTCPNDWHAVEGGGGGAKITVKATYPEGGRGHMSGSLWRCGLTNTRQYNTLLCVSTLEVKIRLGRLQVSELWKDKYALQLLIYVARWKSGNGVGDGRRRKCVCVCVCVRVCVWDARTRTHTHTHTHTRARARARTNRKYNSSKPKHCWGVLKKETVFF